LVQEYKVTMNGGGIGQHGVAAVGAVGTVVGVPVVGQPTKVVESVPVVVAKVVGPDNTKGGEQPSLPQGTAATVAALEGEAKPVMV
jgi:hypothetical protein